MKVYNNPEVTKVFTSSWTGDRSEDGRPKAGDRLLQRLRDISLEEAWTPMFKKGYKNQAETRFQKSNPGVRLIGRAVTCSMVPSRPDVHLGMLDYGWKEGYVGYFNQWVVDEMQENDVLVADCFDKIAFGTFLGGNLSTSIKARSKPGGGAVIWGGIRDLEQLQRIDNFQVYYRGIDPSYIDNEMLA
ncbi:MAG: RraA family protein, partial [Bacillota bacterium]|nr:RraA family protein [Bacillota bacterium]